MSSTLSEAAPASGMAAPRQTAGSWLRDARQRHGLHIVALAATLKVHPSKLEALEADRWDELPDTTFVRALAKSICRVLKIDAAPVLTLLPNSEDRELTMSRGLNQPFRDRTAGEGGFSSALLQKPVVWGPALLLAAAVGVYLMPAAWLPSADAIRAAGPAASEASEGQVSSAGLPVSVDAPLAASAAAPVLPPVPAPMLLPVPLVAASAANTSPAGPAPAGVAPTIATNATPNATPAAGGQDLRLNPQAATPAKPLVAAASASVAPPPAGSVPLVVKVSSESWVEVVDASGRTLLSKLLRPGDAQNLAGLPPLRVRVGNVAGTELILRGEPVDLLSRAKDNVARLELP